MKMTKEELEKFLSEVEIVEESKYPIFKWIPSDIITIGEGSKRYTPYYCPKCMKVSYIPSGLTDDKKPKCLRNTYCGFCGNKNIDWGT